MRITANIAELTRKLATLGAASLLLASPAFAADDVRQPEQAGANQHQEQHQAGAAAGEYNSEISNANLSDNQESPAGMETSSVETHSERTSTSSEFTRERSDLSQPEGVASIEDRDVSASASESVTGLEDSSDDIDQSQAATGTAEIHMLESGETYSIEDGESTDDSLAGSTSGDSLNDSQAAMSSEQSSFDENHGSLTGAQDHGFEDSQALTGSDDAEQSQLGAAESDSAIQQDDASTPMLGATPGTGAADTTGESLTSPEESVADASDESIIESLVDTRVVNSNGEQLGSVAQVVVNRETGEAGLVLSVDSGQESKQILAPIDEIALQGDELVWQTSQSSDELADAEEYDSENFERVSGTQGAEEDAITAAEPTSISAL